MIKSILSVTAALALCVLLTGCSESDPATAGRDKGPRPTPPTPQAAPDLGAGTDTAQGGAPGGGRTGGGAPAGGTP